MDEESCGIVRKLCEDLPVLVEMEGDGNDDRSLETFTSALRRLFVGLISPIPCALLSQMVGHFQLSFFAFCQSAKRQSSEPLACEAIFNNLVQLCEALLVLFRESLTTRSESQLLPLYVSAVKRLEQVSDYQSDMRTIAAGKVLRGVERMKEVLSVLKLGKYRPILVRAIDLTKGKVEEWKRTAREWLEEAADVSETEMAASLSRLAQVTSELEYLSVSFGSLDEEFLEKEEIHDIEELIEAISRI